MWYLNCFEPAPLSLGLALFAFGSSATAQAGSNYLEDLAGVPTLPWRGLTRVAAPTALFEITY
jgi:hypothetical protein